MTRTPYHARMTMPVIHPVAPGQPYPTRADVDQMLDMAVWCEANRYYPEAYTFLRDALAAEHEMRYCDLGHYDCEDHLHSAAYHSADCACGQTEATCTEE